MANEKEVFGPGGFARFRDNLITRFLEKFDKNGGEITGDVKIDGNLSFDIEDGDYDAGIRVTKGLDNNAGTVITLTGYANTDNTQTNYKPVIRNVSSPINDYDVANKRYVDAQIVRPLSYLVFLNPDGTIDAASSQLDYKTIKAALTSMTTNVYLDVIQDPSRFYVQAIQDVDVNNGPVKFLGYYSKDGNIVEIEFSLASDNTLTHSIRVLEHIGNKSQSVVADPTRSDMYPSNAAVFNEFQRRPVTVWETDGTTGLLSLGADVSANLAWQLTDLDLTPYRRIKIYAKSGRGSTNASLEPSKVLELFLDGRGKNANTGCYIASMVFQNPNDSNRTGTLTCAVSEDKTKFAVTRMTSLYGTAASSNNGTNSFVYMIEGYYD